MLAGRTDPIAMNAQEKNETLRGLRYGPYITPIVAEGVVVECEVRGLVTVVGISDAPIPWPIGERDGDRQPIVFKALARAVIVIGGSAGGIEALSTVLTGLPRSLNASVFAVLHTSPQSGSALPQVLARTAILPVAFAIDGEVPQRGHVYVAQPD